MAPFPLTQSAARRSLSVVALVLASSHLLWAAAEGPQDLRIRPRQRTRAAVKAALRLMPPPGTPPHDAGVSVDPPPSQLPRPTAWRELAQTTMVMTAYLQRIPGGQTASPFGRLASQAVKFAQEALTDLIQVETDFPGALQNLKQSVFQLTFASQYAADSAERQFAGRVQSRLAGVGVWLAWDGIVRAYSAGLRDDRLSRALTALRTAAAQVAAGQYVVAFEQLGPGVIVGNLPYFRLDLYEQNIRNAFEGQVVGYQYAIAKQGLLVSTRQDGVARTSADPPATPQSASKEMNIASVSKTITATVLVQLLEDKGISVDSSIEPYLPASWVRGPGVDDLSFRSLLTHSSGLDDNRNRDYRLADLESYIAAGVEGVNDDGVKYKDIFQYQNANFALFRVAIPYLLYGEDGIQEIYEDFAFTFEDMIAWLYIDAVRIYALDQTGFVDADCQADDPVPTLRYGFPTMGRPVRQPGTGERAVAAADGSCRAWSWSGSWPIAGTRIRS